MMSLGAVNAFPDQKLGKSVLIAVQHELTEEQKSDLLTKFETIVNLKEVNPNLFNQLASSPDNVPECVFLARQFIMFGRQFDAVLMPIGSPLFNCVLYLTLFAMKEEGHFVPMNFLFSHSDRNVIEETTANGEVIKKTIFKHKKFEKVSFI